jgi:hypothetical protein
MTDDQRKVFGPWPDNPTTCPIVSYLQNDTEVLRILVEHHRSHSLERRPGITGPFRYHCYWGDQTRFYLATRYVDYDDPKDNGYSMVIIERATCSIDDAEKIFRRWTVSGATGPVEFDKVESFNLSQQ